MTAIYLDYKHPVEGMIFVAAYSSGRAIHYSMDDPRISWRPRIHLPNAEVIEDILDKSLSQRWPRIQAIADRAITEGLYSCAHPDNPWDYCLQETRTREWIVEYNNIIDQYNYNSNTQHS